MTRMTCDDYDENDRISDEIPEIIGSLTDKELADCLEDVVLDSTKTAYQYRAVLEAVKRLRRA